MDPEGPNENIALQEEELAAVKAIYDTDCDIDLSSKKITVYIPNKKASKNICLQIRFPPYYPSIEHPELYIKATHLSKVETKIIYDALTNDIFQEGEPVVYNWVEWVRDHSELYTDRDIQFNVAAGERLESPLPKEDQRESDSHQQDLEEKIKNSIIHGEAFTEKKSTFQAHLCPVHSLNEVNAFVEILKLNNKINNATHNILAYRFATRNGYHQDADDDGEDAAGSRLLSLLQITKAENVAVVVSRWFGGSLLGPKRFSYINNAARKLLAENGYIT